MACSLSSASTPGAAWWPWISRLAPRPLYRWRASASLRRCPSARRLGVYASRERGLGDPADRNHVRGRAHVDLVLLRHLEHVVEGLHHDLFQARVDRGLAPEEVLQILHPLEVTHGHAAGVAEDVRDEEHALLVENPIGFGRGGSVRGLGDDLRLYARGVVFADLVLDRRRDEDVAVELQELRVRDPFRAREAGDRAGLAFVRVDAIRVDALRVHDRATRLREPNDHGPELGHQLRREAAGVPESL